MKVLLFCAKGFEAMEFSPFIDVMGWAADSFHFPVSVDTCGFSQTVAGAFNVHVIADKTIDKIRAEEYDALAIPGGFEEYGFYDEAYSEEFLELIRAFDRQRKPIASVCVGALPIGKSGVLKGRRGTTYHLNNGARQKQLAEFGVNVINERIVIDDNIITSFSPETAPHVAFELLRKLVGDEKMLIVKKSMGF